MLSLRNDAAFWPGLRLRALVELTMNVAHSLMR